MNMTKPEICLDKLIKLYNPKPNMHDIITNKMKNILNTMDYKSGNFQAYRNALSIPLTGEGHPYFNIYANPYRKNLPFFKAGMNPTKLNDEGLIDARKWLDYILSGSYAHFYNNSTVSLIDIALDFKGIIPNEVFVNISSKQQSMMYFDKNTMSRTVYYGHKDKNQVIIYDKGLDKNGKGNTEKMTRIEFRMRENIKLNNLSEQELTLKGIDIYNISAIDKNEEIPQCFVDSCHYRGIKAAQELLDDNDREIFKFLLESSKLKLPSEKYIHRKYLKSLSRLDCLLPDNTYPSITEIHPELVSGKIKGDFNDLDDYLSDLGEDDDE